MGKQNGLRGHFLLFPFALFKLSMRLFKTLDPQKHTASQINHNFHIFLAENLSTSAFFRHRTDHTSCLGHKKPLIV